jgi:hypothetical protein
MRFDLEGRMRFDLEGVSERSKRKESTATLIATLRSILNFCIIL